MSVIAKFRDEIGLLKGKGYVEEQIIDRFIKRIEERTGLTREDNPASHFCSFFLPVNIKTKSIYLVHHIKANDWMPPGGHIDKGELPIETVYREFSEELQHSLTDEEVRLFDLSIIDIDNPLNKCRRHYDLWYLVFTNQYDFIFCKREFFKACWMGVNCALKKIKTKEYRQVIQKIPKIFQDN